MSSLGSFDVAGMKAWVGVWHEEWGKKRVCFAFFGVLYAVINRYPVLHIHSISLFVAFL